MEDIDTAQTQDVGRGGNDFERPPTEEARQQRKINLQKTIDLEKEALRKSLEKYLAKNRELRRVERNLNVLERRVAASENRGAQAESPEEQQRPIDLDRRLSEVERKLDRILKALGSRGGEPARD